MLDTRKLMKIIGKKKTVSFLAERKQFERRRGGRKKERKKGEGNSIFRGTGGEGKFRVGGGVKERLYRGTR